MKSIPRSNPSISSREAPGPREDGSVMFSLTSLVAQASNDAPTPKETTVRKDDSGLIDLKALAAQIPENAAPVATHVPIFPFGSPSLPPPMAMADEPTERVGRKTRKGRWVAASLVAVLASAMAIGAASARPTAEVMTLGGRVSPRFEAAAQRAATPPAPPVVVVTTPPPPKEVATPSLPKPTERVIATAPRKPSEPTQTPKAKVLPEAPKSLPLEVCDLMCQMRQRVTEKK